MRQLLTILALALTVGGASAQSTVGLTVLAQAPGRGPVTVFYPSSSPSQSVQREPFSLDVAQDGTLQAGNRRLIVISHGSGGSPWAQALAASLTPLLVDPPNFARSELPAVYQKMTQFFDRHLLATAAIKP